MTNRAECYTLGRSGTIYSCAVLCVAALAYMYPAERQQVVLVLEAEQLLNILHVAVVGAGRLLGNNHVGQQKLVVHLRDARGSVRQNRVVGAGGCG